MIPYSVVPADAMSEARRFNCGIRVEPLGAGGIGFDFMLA
jgi:hypothetical protein